MNISLSENLGEIVKRSILGNVGERENRENSRIFSYGCPGYVFTAPMKVYDTDSYRFPKSVKYLRDEELGRQNKAASMFYDYLKSYGETIIPEVVHVIRRDLWVETCMWHGITEDRVKELGRDWQKFYTKSHLRLDYLLPDYWVNWEHDGSIWHDTKQDEIRDTYLGRVFPGLRIQRFRDYTGGKKQKAGIDSKMKEILGKKLPYPLKIDYSDYVVETWIDENYESLLVIDTALKLGVELHDIPGKLGDPYLSPIVKELEKGLKP